MEGENEVCYMCAVCFRNSLEMDICHSQSVLYCDAGCWGDERRKPPMAANGRILTRAPAGGCSIDQSLPISADL